MSRNVIQKQDNKVARYIWGYGGKGFYVFNKGIY